MRTRTTTNNKLENILAEIEDIKKEKEDEKMAYALSSPIAFLAGGKTYFSTEENVIATLLVGLGAWYIAKELLMLVKDFKDEYFKDKFKDSLANNNQYQV